MFKNLKQIFHPKSKDIRKRILFTIGALFIFCLGSSIPIPGTNVIEKDLGFLELMNLMGGGSLKNFSIFALGVSPYISASIITSILQMDVFPYFSELRNQGKVGQQKLNKITRYMGIALAFIQGFAMASLFMSSSTNASALEYLRIATIMTAGTSFLLWLGDQITTKGLGNGISLIIMAGIISTLPSMFVTTYTSLVVDASSLFIGIISFVIFIIIYLAIIIGIIYVQESERRIPIQHASKTTSAYGKQQSYIPFKLNSAGVMPVIFASIFLSFPSFIAGFVNNEGFTNFVNKYLSYSTPVGFVVYIVLIFVFGYFYTFLQLKIEDISKNLKNQGSYIPGIRPGKETITYLKSVVSRITLIGTIFLAIIAAIPIIFAQISSLPTSVSIGGTGILIVVGVALETYRQLESSLVNRTYKGVR
ncbi:MAG: preprotein translocase subunit SecY [bacterium]|nr:preprotein translocase subunit SecY [bacterium]